jgi:hypothetical protein
MLRETVMLSSSRSSSVKWVRYSEVSHVACTSEKKASEEKIEAFQTTLFRFEKFTFLIMNQNIRV